VSWFSVEWSKRGDERSECFKGVKTLFSRYDGTDMTSYWICQLTGWGLLTLIKLIAAVEVDRFPWASTTVWLLLVHAAGLGLTHALRGYMRRHHWSEARTWTLVWRGLLASFILALPLAAVSTVSPIAMLQNPDLPERFPAHIVPQLAFALNLVNTAFVFVVWLVIYFVAIGIRQHQLAALRQSELARALQQAQLRLLKSQLNPHFLFNALNTVRSLIAEDAPKAQRAVTRLANTLRYTLGAGQHELVSFERELDMVSDFLELEKMRFEERLCVVREVAAATGTAQIPAMLLQTVVENAIKHGIAELPAGGTLRIHADMRDDVLVLEVENPRPLGSTRKTSEGTGLRNAQERLRLLFNSRASLELDLSQPEAATTRIRIPQHL